jgi:pimeloyl-ACP methyl ester carboxylesterase
MNDSKDYKLKRFFIVILAIVSLGTIRYAFVEHGKAVDSQKSILNFEVHGEAIANVVLLHGLMASLHYWDGIVPELAKNNRVISLDLLGFGDSPKPKADYSVAEHLGFIERTFDKTLGESKKFVLIGHSMGTFLALNYAALHPERLNGLVIIDPPIVTSDESLKEDLKASTSAIMLTMTFSKFWGKLTCKIHELFPLLMYPLVRFNEPDLPPQVAKDALKHNWESFSGSLKNVLEDQKFEDLISKVPQVPILIIGGTEDVHMKKQLLEEMLRRRPNVELKWVDGRHNFLLKHPEKALDAILPFLRKNGA